MKHTACWILNVVALWVFVLIYSLKGYKVEPIKPKELIDIKVDTHIELPTLDEIQLQQQKELKAKAFDLVNSYIGRKGDCFKIAIAFVKELKGIEDYEIIKINKNEIQTGDIVFYQNNGIDNTHYSVVLDVEDNIALHGNIEGKTKIRKIYEPNMTKPIFYRLERK